METRIIELPQGGTLELTIKPGFYDAIRKQFMLQPDQEVTNDLIRMFIFGAVNGAIGSAEETIKDSLCNTCHHTFARHNNACDCGACEIFAANSGK